MIDIKDIQNFELYSEGKLKGQSLTDFKNRLKSDNEFSNAFESFNISVKSVKYISKQNLKIRLNNIHKEIIGNKQGFFNRNKIVLSVVSALVILMGSFYLFNQFNSDSDISQEQIVVTDENYSDEVADRKLNRLNKNIDNPKDKFTKEENVVSNKIEKSAIKEEANKTNKLKNNKDEIADLTNQDKTEKTVNKNELFVLSNPIANFGASKQNGCTSFKVYFYDSSTIDDGVIDSFYWTFGDGSHSNLQNPVHTYKNSGIYNVKLSVWSSKGQKAVITKENYITAYSVPDADFSFLPTKALLSNSKIKFTNKTKYFTSGIKYKWNFDDRNTISRSVNPVYTFSDTGMFSVLLTATNDYKCSNKISKNIEILSAVKVFIPNAFSPDNTGPNENNLYKVTANGIKEFHLSIFARTGELVYNSDNYETHGWDGKTKSGSNQTEVFVYKLEVKGLNDVYYDYSGTITLIR